MINKNTVDEITARIAWYLPGTECKGIENDRYMIRVPMPHNQEYRLFTPKDEDPEVWSVELYTIPGLFEDELPWPPRAIELFSQHDYRFAGTPEEIMEEFIFQFPRDYIGESDYEEEFYALVPTRLIRMKKEWDKAERLGEEALAILINGPDGAHYAEIARSRPAKKEEAAA